MAGRISIGGHSGGSLRVHGVPEQPDVAITAVEGNNTRWISRRERSGHDGSRGTIGRSSAIGTGAIPAVIIIDSAISRTGLIGNRPDRTSIKTCAADTIDLCFGAVINGRSAVRADTAPGIRTRAVYIVRARARSAVVMRGSAATVDGGIYGNGNTHGRESRSRSDNGDIFTVIGGLSRGNRESNILGSSTNCG